VDDQSLVQGLDKPLPHIALELFLPAKLLGVDKLAAGQKVGLRLWATMFYREMTMTLGPSRQGQAPKLTAVLTADAGTGRRRGKTPPAAGGNDSPRTPSKGGPFDFLVECKAAWDT